MLKAIIITTIITSVFAYLARNQNKTSFWIIVSFAFVATALDFTTAPNVLKFFFTLAAYLIICGCFFFGLFHIPKDSILTKDFREPEPVDDMGEYLPEDADQILWGHGWW